MSKQIGRVLVALAIATAGLVAAAIGPVSARGQQPSSSTNTLKTAAVVGATDEVLRETSQIRQLSILRPVKSAALSRDDIKRYVIDNLEDEAKQGSLHGTEATLKKLGLVPRDFDLHSFLVQVLTEQVAGYYDAKKQEFFLADWIDLDGQRPVMAHELTHALQDQHFDLASHENWPKGDSDAEAAYHALVEGDATLTMTVYMTRNPSRALAFMKSFGASNSFSSKEIDNAPKSLRASLLFPYEQGMQWAAQIQKEKGWKGLTDAFGDLPRSTEQILHPDKYFAREAPVKVEIPDVSGEFGGKWKRVDYDVHGEWVYYLILNEFLKDDAEAKKAAAGWGGDRYALYESDNGKDTVLIESTAWDSEQDAIEFLDAYVKRTVHRYPGLTVPQLENSNPVDRNEWKTGDGVVVIERRKNRVMIVEGIPDAARMPQILKKLWAKT